MSMKLQDEDLLPGERLVITKPANAMIRRDDYGLSALPGEHALKLLGYAGQEALGGKLHLTNYRLLFKSHRVNRVVGAFSIYLPTITGLNDRSRWLAKKLEVVTRMQSFEFVVWGLPAFIRTIQAQSAQVTVTQARELAIAAQAGGEMGRNQTFLKDAAMFALDALAVVQNPLDAANLLNLLDLVTDDVPA